MDRLLMHRRFGRGAARLALGTPLEAQPLSRAARARGAGERLLALTPGLACLALAAAIGLLASRVVTPPTSTTDPTRIVADAWDVPTDPIVAPVPTRVAPPTAPPRPDVLAEHPPPRPDVLAERPPPPAPEAAPIERAPFDPSVLTARRAPSIPETAATPTPPRTVPTRPGGLPTARPLADLALAVPRSPRAGAPPSQTDDEGFAPPRTDVARPSAPSATSHDVAPAWDAMRERRAFLAGLAAEQDAAATGTAATRAVPTVAASTTEAARAVRAAALERLRAEGWEAVPLEDLPDCQPAGRQDQLKRRILRVAAGRPTCRHAEGVYRFLETRNLNAFLMGARHPDATSGALRGPRDACEVLERALRCLEGTPSKEIGTR
ncbi:MAG: hypothetical protein AAGC67_13990 [Myxococcota bacterium]